MKYEEFFAHACRKDAAFPFQKRFHESRTAWKVLSVPTGLGKTATVLVDYLFRIHTSQPVPRRLAWCLPGRALTRQTVNVVRELVKNAGLTERVRILELMGGSEDNSAVLRPDEYAILVGTQDILLSRALNRGYARKSTRWPVDFGLLNNDCLWVLDEVQLLGEGLATSTQLAAFRELFGAFGRNECVWISATLQPDWLNTIDFQKASQPVESIHLENEELTDGTLVAKRWRAAKTLQRADESCRIPAGVAAFVKAQHREGSLTLVVVNTVGRAREIWLEIRKLGLDAALYHSRFRPCDRKAVPGDGIVVATQVVEAGLDLSARLMVTDICPYPSLVQRFGRVNRYGEEAGEIYWVDRPLTAKKANLAAAPALDGKTLDEVYAPYEADDVLAAEEKIGELRSAAPADLPRITSGPPWKHVLRRVDLLDLFDTTPDLAGNDIDISRFVRLAPDSDVYIAWRDWRDGGKGAVPSVEVTDRELCPVPIGEFRAWAKGRAGYRWDALGKRWVRVAADEWRPGMTAVFHVSEGGYTPSAGWNPASKEAVTPAADGEGESEPYEDDRLSFPDYCRTLGDHTEDVVRELERFLGLTSEEFWGELRAAARLHDWGKAHVVMQETLQNREGPFEAETLLGKQKKDAARQRHSRRFFRHELASALAILANHGSDLTAYLAASHHGRVRLSLRSMPGEMVEGGQDRRVARGIWDGDELGACDLGAGLMGATPLDLECMELGGGKGSWTERMTALRDRLGPFRLAFLEMLLRSADEVGSEKGAPA